MTLQYAFPRTSPSLPNPVWTGRGFRVGDRVESILSYQVETSGWSDELTSFHEDTAGGDHPIDRASRETAIEALRHAGIDAQATILEVGCSSGFFLRALRSAFPRASLIGADYVRGPLLDLAIAEPGLPLLQFDLTRCPLPDASVDAVVLLNVLEHIADDSSAMAHVYRVLKPGGVAVIEVPAGPELYDVYDELLMHCRRYTLPQLINLTRSAGFQISRASHLGVLVYPAFHVAKRRNQRLLAKEAIEKQKVVERHIRSSRSSLPLELALRLERFLGRWLKWPVGIRCTLTAVKPGAGVPT